MSALEALVSGTVQGVFYRKSVQRGCLAAGLRGYARNLADGRVEVVIAGTPEQLARGRGVVTAGSPASQVTDVQWRELPEDPRLQGFQVL